MIDTEWGPAEEPPLTLARSRGIRSATVSMAKVGAALTTVFAHGQALGQHLETIAYLLTAKGHAYRARTTPPRTGSHYGGPRVEHARALRIRRELMRRNRRAARHHRDLVRADTATTIHIPHVSFAPEAFGEQFVGDL